MDTVYITLLVLGALALLGGLAYLPIRDAQKLKKNIEKSFGKAPTGRTGLSNAEAYYASLASAQPCPTALDNITWSDLDMDELFSRINNCQSACGDARLYTVLRRPGQAPPLSPPAGDAQPPAPLAALQTREEWVSLFGASTPLRQKTQYILARLGRYGGSGLDVPIYHAGLLALPNRGLLRLLAVLPLAAPFLAFIHPGLALMGTLAALAVNINLFSVTKAKQDSGFLAVRYLAACLRCAQRLAELLQTENPALSQRLRTASQQLGTLRSSTLMLSFDDLIERSLGFDPAAFFLLPLLSYGKLAKRLEGQGAQVAALYTLVGEVDLSISLLSWRQSMDAPFCTPQFCTQAQLDAENLCHPLIEGAIPNSGLFTGDVLLTGSNASGKSTFIKAVALACVTAQALNTVCATRFALRPGTVATSMAVADSVVDGDSYFVAEIKSMRRLVRLSQQGFCWLFIDEILKGTNTVERIAASSAVLGCLHSAGCICFAATHDIELTTILQGLFTNYHFTETVDDEGVWFSYKLQTGPATSRNAIVLLERMAFPATVTAKARQMVAHFENVGDWQPLATVTHPENL